MESLWIDSRNVQESNPHLEEKTSVKPVFESNLKDSQSCGSTEHNVPLKEPNVNIHGAFEQTTLHLNRDPPENSINKDIQQSPLIGKESGNVSVSGRWGKCQLSIHIIRAEWKTMGMLGKIIGLV